MNESETVHVVDDDEATRDAIAMLIEQHGYVVRGHPSAADFLAAVTPEAAGCAILDMRMPGMDGLELQAEIARRGIALPVVFLTGHGDIPATVQAIKGGAVNFLTKPVKGAALLESIRAALAEGKAARAMRDAQQCLQSLTEREREVASLALTGLPNKEIARTLGISHRTVEIHRARALHKTGANSMLELARLLGAPTRAT